MKLDQILREHGEVAPLPKKKPLPRTRQAEARSLLTKIPYAATREEAERQKQAFQAWCAKRGLAEVGRRVTDKMVMGRWPTLHDENRARARRRDFLSKPTKPPGRSGRV